jgi:hypothetical protein
VNKIIYKTSKKPAISAFLAMLLLASLSCSIPVGQNQSAQQTIAALSVQQTMMAQQQGANLQATSQAADATRLAQEVQATMLVQQATQLAGQTSGGATEPPVPPSSEQPPASTEGAIPPDLEEKIKSAKILLFEDMSGQFIGGVVYNRYIKESLDMAGYSYTDVGSAMGWLKDQLLSTTQWDLIIVASEYKTRITGEYFDYFMEHINRGAGFILELWYLDQIANGEISTLLAKCGIEHHDDWTGVDNLSLWPLVPDHPIFNEPNKNISLRNFANFWPDHGDIVRLTGSGDAEILLGTGAKSDKGVLTSCIGNRVLIQTFLDHDYDQSSVMSLWNNYVYNVLKNRFLASP